jgi:DNA-binding CsgD family transcriptional regulator
MTWTCVGRRISWPENDQCPVSDIIDFNQVDWTHLYTWFFLWERADDMIANTMQRSANLLPGTSFRSRERRASVNHGRDLGNDRTTKIQLREALAREEGLHRQIDELIRKQEVLSRLFAGRDDASRRVHSLSPREHQILDLVLAGHPSKNIAADLHINIRTVENHRASIMKKTGSKSIPALARLALAATWSDTGEAVARTGISIVAA